MRFSLVRFSSANSHNQSKLTCIVLLNIVVDYRQEQCLCKVINFALGNLKQSTRICMLLDTNKHKDSKFIGRHLPLLIAVSNTFCFYNCSSYKYSYYDNVRSVLNLIRHVHHTILPSHCNLHLIRQLQVKPKVNLRN